MPATTELYINIRCNKGSRMGGEVLSGTKGMKRHGIITRRGINSHMTSRNSTAVYKCHILLSDQQKFMEHFKCPLNSVLHSQNKQRSDNRAVFTDILLMLQNYYGRCCGIANGLQSPWSIWNRGISFHVLLPSNKILLLANK